MAEGITEQCSAVKEYFLRVIPNKYSQLQSTDFLLYKEIKRMLVDKTATATFLFVISFAELFTHVLAILQRENHWFILSEIVNCY